MIKICIDNREENLENIDKRWITQQINRRITDGTVPCVQVSINEGRIDLILSTPTCRSTGGGSGRSLNELEQRVVNLWIKQGLNDENFSGGNLIAFLNQINI